MRVARNADDRCCDHDRRCGAAALATWFALRGSLPQIEGEIADADLSASATIERDAEGAPTIRARIPPRSGFRHRLRAWPGSVLPDGPDASCGGGRACGVARRGARRYRQEVSRAWLSARRGRSRQRTATEAERALLDAYTAGVNKRSPRLDVRPWEYLVLRTQPAPWTAEDSVLVAFSMYLNLNDSTGEEELARGRCAATLPPALFAFLHPFGTQWDAPVTGGVWRAPAIPGAGRHGSAQRRRTRQRDRSRRAATAAGGKVIAGSNSWAVAGTHASGRRGVARERHASRPASAARVVSRAADRRRGGRSGARSRRRDAARIAGAGRRQQRPSRLGLHEQLRRLDRSRRRRSRSRRAKIDI